MRPRSLVVPTVLAALLAAPLSAAAWKAHGMHEPDTLRDARDGLMALSPDVSPDPGARTAYFSVAPMAHAAAVNPNVGAAGTSAMPFPNGFYAILGVWKDCNRDGFVGLGETGFASYQAELLPATDVCPPRAADPRQPGYSPAHHDGAWVHELHVIGGSPPKTPSAAAPAWNTLFEPGARVWADWGLPEDRTWGACLSTQHARGTFRSTGGLLRHADCHLGWAATGAVNALARQADPLAPLSFEDAPQDRPDQSGSALNRPNPYGDERAPSAARVTDCSAEKRHVSDPSGAAPRDVRVDEANVTVAGQTVFRRNASQTNVTDDEGRALLFDQPVGRRVAPAPSTAEGWTPAGTVAGALDEADDDCDRPRGLSALAGAAYLEPGSDPQPLGAARNRTDFFFMFRAAEAMCSVFGAEVPRGCAPSYGGLQGVLPQYALGGLPGTWTSNDEGSFANPFEARNPVVNRADLQPWGGLHLTAYAKVDLDAIGARAPGAGGTYGSPHCDGARPLTGWFECDPGAWNTRRGGGPAYWQWQVKVGETYRLRDVDCYDYGATPGTTGPSSLLGRPCERP